jgi:hypothetical protein
MRLQSVKLRGFPKQELPRERESIASQGYFVLRISLVSLTIAPYILVIESYDLFLFNSEQ